MSFFRPMDFIERFGVHAGIDRDLAYLFYRICRDAHPNTWKF